MRPPSPSPSHRLDRNTGVLRRLATSVLGIPRAVLAIGFAILVVVVALFLPLPPPVVIGLGIAAFVIAGIVWLVS